MSTSTSAEANAAPAAGLRQRSCHRVCCAEPAGETQCCDDTCLVEIARRDCNSDPSHRERLPAKPCGDPVDDDAPPCRADEEPCESHYLKAREAYSGLLENIGCICRVLLSLNLDSCCVAPPDGPLRGKRSSGSMRKSLVTGASMPASARSPCKPREVAEGCIETCCSDAPLASQEECLPRGSKCNDTGGAGSCCGGSSIPTLDRFQASAAPSLRVSCEAETDVERTCASALEDQSLEKSSCSRGESKVGCCSADFSPVVPPGDCSRKKCCSDSQPKSTTGQVIIDSHPVLPGDCSRKKCCSDSQPKPTTGQVIIDSHPVLPGDCSRKKCCSDSQPKPTIGRVIIDTHGDPIDTCSAKVCSSEASANAISDGCCTSSSYVQPGTPAGDKPANYAQAGGVEEVDVEKRHLAVEHVVLSVQGMTCVGCEKKLYKSLNMIADISDVKTSLLLAQAEFDLRGCVTAGDALNTIKVIEKTTGFTCTRMTQSSHELDLIVDDLASDLVLRDFPTGVSDIAILDTHTVRVVYQPKLVGARSLMADPFFKSPRLAPVPDSPLIASGRAHVRLMLWKTIVAAGLTVPVLVMAWAPIPEREVSYGAASLVLATIVQVYIAGPWYVGAFKALFISRLIEMDLLVVLSTTTAYIYSIIAYSFLVAEKPLSTGSFFETSTLLVTLIMVGRLVSGFARQRAVESISIESLQSSTAILTDPRTHENREIDARLLQYQDVFKSLPDTSIATDGTVIAGTSEVDESMITGEATLVAKNPGSPVVAGSINHSGTLTIRLTRLPSENTIKAIGLMVDAAKSSKNKIQEIADRVASYFIPAILIITVLVFVIWVVVGKVIREYDMTTNCINAMTYAISALIVSCPCAIGLAVPMVLVIAGGVAAKHGVIFKTPETIEIARKVSHVVFDKTGTLTQGILAVQAETYPTEQGAMLAPMLLGLTSNSKHPVSIAIASHLKSSAVEPAVVEKVVSVVGNGIEGTWKGMVVRAGNPHWLGTEDSPCVKEILHLGITVFCVTVNDDLVAVFGLKDSLRPDAIRVVEELKRRSVQISIVSGDNEESVKSVARALAVPDSHVRFRCSPADKQAYVKQMLVPARSVVMFCGDGTNDAVALAQASIGMHVDGGTDIAQNAADAVLVRPALSGIVVLMDLSTAFFHRVVFNFIWSFVYNAFAILLAAGAFPNARIPPQFAGLGEIVSVLPVIAVGLQLKWAKFN